MDKALEARKSKKLELIRKEIESRQGCKLTDEKGRFVRVVRCDGVRLIDDEGGVLTLDQVSLPLSMDADLIECLGYLKAAADEVSKHPQFVQSDAFPVLALWETMLCEAERVVLRPRLSPKQKAFWKQIKSAAQP